MVGSEHWSAHLAPDARRRLGLGTLVLSHERDGRRAARLTLASERQGAPTRPSEPLRRELSTAVLASSPVPLGPLPRHGSDRSNGHYPRSEPCWTVNDW